MNSPLFILQCALLEGQSLAILAVFWPKCTIHTAVLESPPIGFAVSISALPIEKLVHYRKTYHQDTL